MQSNRQKSEGSSDEKPEKGGTQGQTEVKRGSDDDKKAAHSQQEAEGKGQAESAGGEEESNKEKAAEGQQGVEEGGEGNEGKEEGGSADSAANKVCGQCLAYVTVLCGSKLQEEMVLLNSNVGCNLVCSMMCCCTFGQSWCFANCISTVLPTVHLRL